MSPPENTTVSNGRTIELAFNPDQPVARGVIAGVMRGLRDPGGWSYYLAAADHGPPTTRPAAHVVLSCEVGDGMRGLGCRRSPESSPRPTSTVSV